MKPNPNLNPIGRPPKPWTIDGIFYPTTTLAAKALGISPTSLFERSKTLPSREASSADLLLDRRKVPIEIRGVIYPSQTAAAKALGISTWTIRKALENGKLDTVGLGRKPRDEKSS